MQRHRERLAALEAGLGVGAKEYGLAVHGKQLTANHIDNMEDNEIEKLYARYDARLGGGDDEDTGVCGDPALCGGDIHVSPDPGRKAARACCLPRVRPVRRTRAKHCYLRALPPVWLVYGAANRRADHPPALSVWTSMPR